MAASAETLRIATYHAELSRKGPGLLLRDIQKGKDPQVLAIVELLTQAKPDILLLTDIDHDLGLLALAALRDELRKAGLDYPHLFAPHQNSGRDSGHDLDGDGVLQEPEDAHGFGFFTGDGGIALLSRYPVDASGFQDFSKLLWRDMVRNLITDDAVPPNLRSIRRLSSTAHWIIPTHTADRSLTLFALSATPPVFDGPEDLNGRRNHDEIRLLQHMLDAHLGDGPLPPFVILGNANLDPNDGEGRHEAIRALLADPRLQDPEPRSAAAVQEANVDQSGDPALDTANWDDPKPGNLRVDYVLPSRDLLVRDSGVIWPEPGSLAARASRHGLVWVDVDWPETR